jgi:hypothetical protein
VSEAADFETLLRQALTPVDPPADLAERLELTLANLAELAADELESWELAAMRDPRNWVRPVAAIAIGTAAGAGLIILGWRHQHRRQRNVRAAAIEVRRIVRR